MSRTAIRVDAPSPMWDLAPDGYIGWVEDKSGRRLCPGGWRCAAELKNVQFSEISFDWQAPGGGVVSVGVDGQLSVGDAASGSALVPVQQGSHTTRIQVDCTEMKRGRDFIFTGATLQTQITSGPALVNSTLDDASSLIRYTGWTSAHSSQTSIPAIADGRFVGGTVSYTATAGAAATLTFPGEVLYVFGSTGPSFGAFQVNLDGAVQGVYNASSATDCYGVLLWVGQIDPPSDQGQAGVEHQVVITNQIDGRVLALDYFVALSGSGAGGAAAPAAPTGVNGTQPSHGGTGWVYGGGGGAAAPGSTSSAVFPNGPQADQGGSSAGAVIGGIIGGLFALLLAFMLFRYRQYKKAGGEGGFFAVLCGGRRVKPAPKAGNDKGDFKLWPMMRFRPKYAT